MTTLYIIILGIVQGITEFLPVSSSGHLVLLNKIFNIEGNFILLSVVLHVATLLSVCIVLRKEIVCLIKNPFSNLAKKIYLATVQTVIIVLLFKGFFEDAFSGAFLPFCFLTTSFLLFLTSIFKSKNGEKEIKYKTAFLMGVVQGVAVLPGISRSGSTICTGLLLNESKKKVTEFSFLMSIPIIIASLILEVFELSKSTAEIGYGFFDVVLGFFSAFVFGIFSIKFMFKIVQKRKLFYFSIYLIFLTIISFFLI